MVLSDLRGWQEAGRKNRKLVKREDLRSPVPEERHF